MNKLIIIPILFVLAFSQSKGNQVSYASYAIETTTEKYSNVLIDSVYGLWVEVVYDRDLITKVNIPIAEIKSLKQNGWRSNIFVSIIGTAAGGCVGSIVGFIGAIVVSPRFFEFSYQGVFIYIAATGGGALSGYQLVRYIYKRKYEIVDFHKWTIDKKRNYLMSLVNK